MTSRGAEVHIVGHGFGSIAAQAAARLKPKYFKSVTLVSMPELPIFKKKAWDNPKQWIMSWYAFFF